MPEEYRRHEACRMFGWTPGEYEDAPALMVDWAFEIEAAKYEAQTREAGVKVVTDDG